MVVEKSRKNYNVRGCGCVKPTNKGGGDRRQRPALVLEVGLVNQPRQHFLPWVSEHRAGLRSMVPSRDQREQAQSDFDCEH